MNKDKKEVAVVTKEKYTSKPTEDVVESVINDLEALLVERTKSAREYTMMVFWEAGELLRDSEKKFKVNITALVNRVALDNRVAGRQMGERNIWFAIKFFDNFPKFDKVYETEFGENVSISKIKKMLMTPKPKKEKTLAEIAIDLVAKLGVDAAHELVKELEKEIKNQERIIKRTKDEE